eukprot:scaffold2552_cov380-Prasinococcus_capsulatus_cf.AAC.14
MPDRTLQRRGPPPPPLRCSAAEPSGSAPPSASAPFKSWLKLLTEKPTQFYALVFGSLALCTAAMKLAISKFSQEGVSGLAGFTLRERVVYVLESGVKSPDVWVSKARRPWRCLRLLTCTSISEPSRHGLSFPRFPICSCGSAECPSEFSSLGRW